MISALTPCTAVSSRSRLASYPSMMLSSWIPCGTIIRDIGSLDKRDGLYFAECLRRSGCLAQLCQAGIHERVGEDVYMLRHEDALLGEQQWAGEMPATAPREILGSRIGIAVVFRSSLAGTGTVALQSAHHRFFHASQLSVRYVYIRAARKCDTPVCASWL